MASVILCMNGGTIQASSMDDNVSLVGHFSDRLPVVSVRFEPHKGCVSECAELRSIVPRLDSSGIENLVA